MIYTVDQIKDLSRRIRGKDKIVNKALALVLNKSATFAKNESVTEIVGEVNLDPSYVKQRINVRKRAQETSLTAIVSGEERGTLLERFPYSLTPSGASVRVNKAGAALNIVGARMVRLKGSGEMVIGLFNKDAMEAFTKALSKGAGATPKKRKKLFNLEKRAANKPYGRTPLHSRSINQLFKSVREDIQPQLTKFMRGEFLKDFNRLDR
jgi:hypothetical protein